MLPGQHAPGVTGILYIPWAADGSFKAKKPDRSPGGRAPSSAGCGTPVIGIALTIEPHYLRAAWYLLSLMPAHSHQQTHGWALQDKAELRGDCREEAHAGV